MPFSFLVYCKKKKNKERGERYADQGETEIVEEIRNYEEAELQIDSWAGGVSRARTRVAEDRL